MSPTPEQSTTNEQKAVLRRRWQQVLRTGFRRILPGNEAICRLVAGALELKSARTIALYFPRPWEVDLTPLWYLFPDRCAFPRVIPGTREMEFFKVTSLKELEPGFGGINEPQPRSSARIEEWGSADLVLLPGIYFDIRGARLGSGMGFYDRFLAGKTCVSWGVCWNVQYLRDEVIPQMDHDIAARAICTETGIYPASR